MTDRSALLAEFEEELSVIDNEQIKLAKRAQALRMAIAGVRQMISLNGGTAPAEPETATIAEDAFTDMSIKDAAIAYLRTVGKPQTNREIADALIKGGIKSEAGDFPSTLRAVLLREDKKAEEDRELYWELPHWHLSEWPKENNENK
jgi:hypothetical protein